MHPCIGMGGIVSCDQFLFLVLLRNDLWWYLDHIWHQDCNHGWLNARQTHYPVYNLWPHTLFTLTFGHKCKVKPSMVPE